MATVSGGEKLERALADIAHRLNKPATLRVGFLSQASYPDGTKVALVAALNEFGVPSHNQPPRPFFRNMIAKHAKSWPASIKAGLQATNYDVVLTLQYAGMGISDQLRDSINELWSPPLSPVTVKRKGFDKPLIEHAVMRNAVAYEVVIR